MHKIYKSVDKKAIMYKFNSQIQFGPTVPEQSIDLIKNEPMLFSCDFDTAFELGGVLTKCFLAKLSEEFFNAKDLMIDSRVHMLMPNWYPCISGFHHDDVPREREDKQPEYDNPSYRSKHCMALIGGASSTEFALGEAEFPKVSLGEIFYKVWHPIVVEKLNNGELTRFNAPFNQLIYFDDRTWHQGTKATESGWRFFIRASINTGRKPTNELRRQVQVYLENPMEGW